LDAHFAALWDGGYIKFWSKRTMRIRLEEIGFEKIAFRGVWPIPLLAKSIIVTAVKPLA
jgi:hypothetical protein